MEKNQVYHPRTKHIDVRFHKSRELVSSGELLLEKVHISENAIDMLTKPVTIKKFNHCLNLIKSPFVGWEISQSIVPGGVISYVSCLFKGRVNIRQGGDCCSIWLILEIVVGKQKVGGCGGQRPPRYGSRVFLEFHS